MKHSNTASKADSKLHGLALITAIFAWIQIAASPLLSGIILSFIIYILWPVSTAFYVGCVITLAGLVTGVLWATNIWRTSGTVEFMSTLLSSPETETTGRNETVR